MEALIVSNSTRHAWALPHLLSRAGFQVDVVTNSHLLRLSKFVRDVHVAPLGTSVIDFCYNHIRAREKAYDWVIATDDGTLAEIVDLELRTGQISNLLPILPGGNRQHLFSKIGLSHVLLAAGIKTPDFRVANSCIEAINAAKEIGYPILAKVDSSGGGLGVYECDNDAKILELQRLFSQPVLIQKKIFGSLLDLSAIYLGAELVHFSYSKIEHTLGRFGPSVQRTYYPSPLVERAIFDELAALGKVLGANGFVNISCIDDADGSGRYYIEADMRPNVWIDYSVFYGEDPAPKIQDWFSSKISLTKENVAYRSNANMPLMIAHFLRLNILEILINRYNVWKFIPFADSRLVRRLLITIATQGLVDLVRLAIPRKLRRLLRGRFATAGIILN